MMARKLKLKTESNTHMTQDLKTKFRRSSAWKKFRLKVRKEQRLDPITEKPLSTTYNLHHLDLNPEHYTDMSDPSHFIGLNSMSHDLIHFIFGDSGKRKDWRKMLENLRVILEKMETINGGYLE